MILGFIIGLALTAPLWFLRWRVAWRLALGGVLLLITIRVFSTPVGWHANTPIGTFLLDTSRGALWGLGAGFAGRTIWQRVRRGRLGQVDPRLDLGLGASGGALFAVIVAIWLAMQTAQGDPIVAHAMLLGFALAPLGVAFAPVPKVVRATATGMAAGFLAMLIYSGLIHPAKVLASARVMAQGGDHCISLPMRQRPARTRGDLTFLTMDKSPSYYGVPHAALVTSEGVRGYWSFHLAAFRPQSVNTPIAFCDPSNEAGLATKPADGTALVTLRAALYRVPVDYDPLASAGNHLAVSVDPLTGEPAADDLPSAWIAHGQAESVDYLVTEFRSTRPGPHGLRLLDMSDMDEYGPSDTTVYLGTGADGAITTQIECWDQLCLHRFTPNGRDRIIFNHDRVDLPVWRDLEDRITDLFESWRL